MRGEGGGEAGWWGTGWNVLSLPDCCIGMSYREEHKANLEERRVGVELFLQRQTLPPGTTMQGQRTRPSPWYHHARSES